MEPIQVPVTPNKYFNRYVKNSVILEKALQKGRLWKYDFNETNDVLEEKTGFDAVKAWFSNGFGNFLTSKETLRQKYIHIVDKNFAFLSRKPEAVALSPEDLKHYPNSRELKIARIATSRLQAQNQAKYPNAVATLDQEIQEYVRLAKQEHKPGAEKLEVIVRDRTWQNLHPLDVDSMNARISQTINKDISPIIRHQYRTVYVEATKLYHKFQREIQNPETWPEESLVAKDEFVLGKMLYLKNAEDAKKIYSKKFSLDDKTQILTHIRNGHPEFILPDLIYRAYLLARQHYPEFFVNFQLGDINPSSYQFTLIANIMTGGRVLPQVAQEKLASQIRLEAAAHINPEFRKAVGRIEGLTPSPKQLSKAYEWMQSHYPQLMEDSLRLDHYGRYSDEGRQSMREAALTMAKIMWGTHIPEGAIVDEIFFRVKGNERLIHKSAMRNGETPNFVEFFMRMQKFQKAEQYELSTQIMQTIPFAALAEKGVSYVGNPRNPLLIHIGNQDFEIPPYIAYTPERGAELIAQSRVKMMLDYLENMSQFQGLLDDPILDRLPEVINTFTFQNDGFTYAKTLSEGSKTLDPGLDADIRQRAKDLGLDEEKAVVTARRLGQIHILSMITLLKKEFWKGQYLGQFSKDCFARPSFPIQLTSPDKTMSEVFSTGQLALESYSGYGTTIANRLYQHLMSLSPDEIAQHIEKSKKLAAATLLPPELTRDDLSQLLRGTYKATQQRAAPDQEDTIAAFLRTLTFSPAQLAELRRKTGLNDHQLQTILVNQTAHFMLFAHQTLPALSLDPPIGSTQGIAMSLLNLSVVDKFPTFSTTNDPINLVTDPSLTRIEVRSAYTLTTPVPLGKTQWEFALSLDPDARTSFRSAIDQNFRVTPVGIQHMATFVEQFHLPNA